MYRTSSCWGRNYFGCIRVFKKIKYRTVVLTFFLNLLRVSILAWDDNRKHLLNIPLRAFFTEDNYQPTFGCLAPTRKQTTRNMHRRYHFEEKRENIPFVGGKYCNNWTVNQFFFSSNVSLDKCHGSISVSTVPNKSQEWKIARQRQNNSIEIRVRNSCTCSYEERFWWRQRR